MEKKFGFYPYRRSYAAGDVRIEPLPNIDGVVDEVSRKNLITGGWLYPPLVRDRLFFSPITPIRGSQSPLVPARRFQLPATHILRHGGTRSSDRLNFLILCVGFLLGMRLVPDGWGHFFRTPIEDNKLTDLVTTGRDIEQCIPLFDNFWLQHNAAVRANMFNAINMFQLASSYHHQYEQFIFQYVALDSIYRLFVDCGHILERRVLHADRPRLICKKLGVPIPQWARKRKGRGANALSDVRNSLFHEGSIGGRAVGFSFIREKGMLLGLQALNCRALLYVLGVRESYISSPVTTRQMHGLSGGRNRWRRS